MKKPLTDKDIDLGKLTGAEILFRRPLGNKMLIEVPNTQAHLLLTFHPKGINAYCIELGSTRRCRIGKNLDEKMAGKLIKDAMENKDHNAF